MRRRSRELPAALDAEPVLALQFRRDLVPDDRVDLLELGVLVAGICLADDPLRRVHAGDDSRSVCHPVRTATVFAAEGHANRHGLYPLDREFRNGLDKGGLGHAGVDRVSLPSA